MANGTADEVRRWWTGEGPDLAALGAAIDAAGPAELDAAAAALGALLAMVEQRRAALPIHESQMPAAREFEFEFSASGDPRKGVPFVARLSWRDGKLARDFVDLPRAFGRKSVAVQGRYRARAGELIEQRTGGSWKNDYRDWSVVDRDGALRLVCGIDSASGKLRAERYLRGEIDLDALLGRVAVTA